jgi:AcrR family transcriptional regulator
VVAGANDLQSAESRLRRDAQANQERVLAAAVTAVLRDGEQVPMATIAAEAGVGVGTLYRRYPTREALLGALTERAFGLVLDCAREAEAGSQPGLTSLDRFLDCVIARRGQLVLPLHGGPTKLPPQTVAVRAQVHATLGRILQRGHCDGSIRADATTIDVIVLGAMLAQPLPNTENWDRIARRQKSIFLAGLAAHRPAEQPLDPVVSAATNLDATAARHVP